MKRMILCIFLISLFSACAEATSYDGKWWNAVSKDERTGSLAGASIAQSMMPDRRTWLTFPTYSNLGSKVLCGMHQILETGSCSSCATSSQGSPQKQRCRSYSEKHGIFDGEYWRQLLMTRGLVLLKAIWYARSNIRSLPHLSLTRLNGMSPKSRSGMVSSPMIPAR